MLIIILILTIPILCFCELIPISKYIGKHNSKCIYSKGLTGNIVGNKIYTFGGCYPIPYVVDPNDDIFISRYDEKLYNITDLSYSYDITNDKWNLETQTPYPMSRANTEVVKNSIYFFEIKTHYEEFANMEMWKYDTQTKIWTHINTIPFLWHGTLASCHNSDKIYFGGTYDGNQINIIHVYNTITNNWESPIYLDKRVIIRQMLCNEKYIKIIGKEIKKEKEEKNIIKNEDFKKIYDLISIYYNGSVKLDNINVTGNFDRVSKYQDCFYFLDISKSESIISKLNINTYENKRLTIIPFSIYKPLFIPYNNEIYLIGGGNRFRKQNYDDDKIKTFNHKLIESKRKNVFILQNNY